MPETIPDLVGRLETLASDARYSVLGIARSVMAEAATALATLKAERDEARERSKCAETAALMMGESLTAAEASLSGAEARGRAAVEALKIVDEDVRHHLRSDEIHAAMIRPHAIRAVRAALAP